MDSLKLIEDLAQAFGAPGFEDDVIKVAKKYVPKGYTASHDSLLNFYMQKERDPSKPTVLLDAHSDEVGCIVQAIKDNGSIVFAPLGEWVAATIYAQRIDILNLNNEVITGVIASKMTHFGADEGVAPKIHEMVIDVGASSKQEVIEKFNIAPGCPIVPKSSFEQFGDVLISKAFDCRLGCAAVIEVLERANGLNLGVNLEGVLSSQEEIGHRGATVAGRVTKPDVVICFEGSPADDTLVEPHMVQTRMGQGPMLRHMDGSMITNPRFLRFALDIAKRCQIPCQESVRTRSYTNGAAFHLRNNGIPTIVISCPVRYVHSHNSMAKFSDYLETVRLTLEVVKGLDREVVKGF